MKQSILFFLINTACIPVFCQSKAPFDIYQVPDSINAIAYYAEMKIIETNLKKRKITGIAADKATVGLAYSGEQKTVQCIFSGKAQKTVAAGKDVDQMRQRNAWKYDWQPGETYPLLIATASDSAAYKTLYSGYVYLPKEKKWKLITTRSYDDTTSIKYIGNKHGKKDAVTYSNRWLQRSTGSWKALDSQTTKPPSLRQMSNIDSLVQQKTEEDLLRTKLPKDSIIYEEGMFYQTIKEGTGRMVKVTDTLTVHYKGSLFSDGSVFDETKDKPATFPLERLIKGWQLGLAHCKMGGKMRLFLPSGSAYGIRTRSAEIPPNSILVFEVKVLDAKEKIIK